MPAEAPPAPAAPPSRPTGPAQVIARPTTATVIDPGPKYPLSGLSARPGAESKPGEAKKGLFDKIASKAKGAAAESAPEKPAEVPKPETPPAKPETTPETPPTETPETPPAKPEETKAKGKVNPWKLVDEHKAARAKAESEVVELKKLVPNAEERRKELELVKQIHDRNKQLEDEIRYVRYESSKEFKEQYDDPYTNAWRKGMSELEGLSVNEGEGQSRPFTADDMLTLVNLPAAKAQQVAEEAFGNMAGEVMAQRREIRKLNDARMAALDKAKKDGAIREQENLQKVKTWHEQTNGFIKENWDKVNAATLEGEHGEYFKPHEGDADWNQRLAKGYELADNAFKDNIKDPRLTAEQRQTIIKRHAAVRMRCAGWGALRHQNGVLKSKVSSLEKEIAELKGTTPGAGGRETSITTSNGQMSGMDRLKANLQKRVKVY